MFKHLWLIIKTSVYSEEYSIFIGLMLFVCVLLEFLAGEVTDTGGVTFVSAFQGLFTPYWNAEARGHVCL